MKQFIISLFLSVMVLIPTVCIAQIPYEALNIGGIYFYQDMNEIIEKYGDSVTSTPRAPKGFDYFFKVDDALVKIFPFKGKIMSFSIDNKSKLKTAAGIGIAMKYEDIVNAYGEPDYVEAGSDSMPSKVYYFTPNVYPDTPVAWTSYNCSLIFTLYGEFIDSIAVEHKFKFDTPQIMP